MNTFARALRLLLAGLARHSPASARLVRRRRHPQDLEPAASRRARRSTRSPRRPSPACTSCASAGDIVYSDDQGNYLIYPSRDAATAAARRPPARHRTKTDLTDQRLTKLMEKEVPKLPYGDALVFKQGSGARRMVVFEDPNCHYCKDAERNFMQLEGRDDLHLPDPDPGRRLGGQGAHDLVLEEQRAGLARRGCCEGEMPPRPMGACDVTTLDRNLDLAARHHLNYTPAIIFDDGSRFAGNADLEHLTKRLDEVAAATQGLSAGGPAPAPRPVTIAPSMSDRFAAPLAPPSPNDSLPDRSRRRVGPPVQGHADHRRPGARAGLEPAGMDPGQLHGARVRAPPQPT